MRKVEQQRRPNPLLKRQRELRGWSQGRVAEELQTLFPEIAVTGKEVGRWERGQRRTSYYYQEKLCVLFQISADKLGFLSPDDPLEPRSEQGETAQREEHPASMPLHGSHGELVTENMVQSEEREHISERIHPDNALLKPDGDFLSVDGMWFPASTSALANAPRVIHVGSALWFVEKQQQWRDLVESYYGRGLLCVELQAQLRQEVIGMKPHPENMDYTISRRQAIGTLISFPLSLLTTLSQHKRRIAPEEFLPQCTASITACWDALDSGDWALIGQALPRYLPVLVSWSRQSSKYQQMAAYLSAQGSLLMYFVLYHRCRFDDGLAYAYQAVDMAKVSQDRDLYVFALILLGTPLELSGQPEEKHKWLVEATKYSKDVVLPLQSCLFAELGYSYALNGMGSEALENISKARDLFTNDSNDVPHFVSSYDFSQLIVNEGSTRLILAEKDERNRQTHCKEAGKALAQIEHAPPTLFIPQRTKLQILNQQAQVAIWDGNMDDFLKYFHAGIEGIKVLGSEKRWQELRSIWRAACAKWPHEDCILKLSVVLLER